MLNKMFLQSISLLLLLMIVVGLITKTQQQQHQYYGSLHNHLQSSISNNNNNGLPSSTIMPTVTVRGFLNFRTTVDGTVIVFTPSPNNNNNVVLSTTSTTNKDVIKLTATTTNQLQSTNVLKPTITSTTTSTSTSTPTINHKQYPTGLVTVLDDTIVNNDGSTILYETKVIGTYINGKYAQILSSTTKLPPSSSSLKLMSPTIKPTNTYFDNVVRPTKMAFQQHNQQFKHRQNHDQNENQQQQQQNDDDMIQKKSTTQQSIHPLRAKSIKLMENSKMRNLNARLQLNPLKSRWIKYTKHHQNNNSSFDEHQDNNNGNNNDENKIKRLKVLGSKRFQLPSRQQSPRIKMNRFKSKLPPTQAEEMQNYYQLKQQQQQQEQEQNNTTKIDDETKEKILENLDNNNNDSNGNNNDNITNNDDNDENKLSIDPTKVIKEVQTITSEVTQHVNGDHLQIKTLTLTKTIERTLHPTETDEFNTDLIKPSIDIVGNNIEATSIPETPSLVISRTYSITERTMRTTIVPIFDGTSTQSHTVTESFFIRKLITAYRTLPPGDMILIDSTTTDQTSTDNSNIMNTELLINATNIDDDLSMAEQQTIQPTSVDSNILPTEMQILLDDNNLQTISNNNNNVEQQQQMMPSFSSLQQQQQQPQTNQLVQQFDLNNPLLLAAILQNPQLAALYIGLQQQQQQQLKPTDTLLSPSIPQQQYQTITKPTKIMQTETLYNTKLISYYDGRQTRSRTVLEPTSTIEKLINTYTTELIPQPMMPQPQQQQQINPLLNNNNLQIQNLLLTKFNGLLQQQQQQQQQMQPQQLQFLITPTIPTSTILKTITKSIDETITKSKIYTLVYNAFSTRYRTITSTTIIPTTITTIMTETIIPSMLSTNILSPMNFFG